MAESKIRVDPWLRVAGAPAGSILALGDCAAVDGQDEPLPQTAQVGASAHDLLHAFTHMPPSRHPLRSPSPHTPLFTHR